MKINDAAKQLDLKENELDEFDVVCPFNGHRLRGFMSRRQDHRYGALVITHVDDYKAPQMILATPKFHYPMDRDGVDKNVQFRFPEAQYLEAYEKLDGTNIFGYTYTVAGEKFVTYKVRLNPVLRSGKWGDWVSLWSEMLAKYPLINHTVRKYNGHGLSFELWGCVAAGTRVLTADLRWVNVADLAVGDKLCSFDADPVRKGGGARFWKTGTVLHKKIEQLEGCYTVTFEGGLQLITTAEHPWFRPQRHSTNAKWCPTQNLRPGMKIQQAVHCWSSDDVSYESGWLAGFFDGEGTVSKETSSRKVCIEATQYQKNQDVADRAVAYLRGFDFESYYDGRKVRALGGKSAYLKFIGITRPVRFLRDFRPERLGSFYTKGTPIQIVKSVEKLNTTVPIVRLAVDSETYIAEGFGMHNSRNKHLIIYDEPLETTLLFGVNHEGHIVPPSGLGFAVLPCPAPAVTIVDSLHDLRGLYRSMQAEMDATVSEDAEMAGYRGTEGRMWYLKGTDGLWHPFKVKPDTIEAIHFAAGGLGRSTIWATAYNAFETSDEVTPEAVATLLLEEFDETTVQKAMPAIVKAVVAITAEIKERKQIYELYESLGLDIKLDKVGTMRALSAHFPRTRMKYVYNVLIGGTP